MILKTPAIPLYFTNVSNTSRIVTWLTARYGKLSTIIKGEQRKNSLFRGQYDLFSTSELVFYDRTEKGMHIAKECSMLHPRPVFRTDWKACAAAGYISALFAKTSLRHGHEPGRFEFFEEMLSHAETYGHCAPFLVWFDLQFSEQLGHRIQLSEQETGGGGQETGDRGQGSGEAGGRSQAAGDRRHAYRFAADHGGLVEPGYASKYRIPSSPISPEAVALLKAWQEAPTPKSVMATQYNPPHLAKIERVI
jgi:recombinational DNA repair protein (RecF pathway)